MTDQPFIERVYIKALDSRFHWWAIGKTPSINSNQTKLHSTRSGSVCSAAPLGLGLHMQLSIRDGVSCKERAALTFVAVPITRWRNNKGGACVRRGVCFQGCLFSIFLFLGNGRQDDDLPLPAAVRQEKPPP